MHKYAELFKLLLFFAVIYGGIAWFAYRTRKKQREAAELKQAQAEQKQMPRAFNLPGQFERVRCGMHIRYHTKT